MLVKKLNFQHDNASATLMFFKGLITISAKFRGIGYRYLTGFCWSFTSDHPALISP